MAVQESSALLSKALIRRTDSWNYSILQDPMRASSTGSVWARCGHANGWDLNLVNEIGVPSRAWGGTPRGVRTEKGHLSLLD
jgi:hypothetical protein